MADFNAGTLKGSITIDFGSVRQAEKALKSLHGQFSKYTSASAAAVKASKRASEQNKANSRSATKLQADINSLNKRMESMRQSLRSTRASSTQVNQSWQETSEAFAKAQSVILNTESSTDSVRDAFVQFDKVLVSNKQAINKSASGLKEQARAAKEAEKATEAATRAAKASAVTESRKEKALTSVQAARKQLLILERQSAAVTTEGKRAIGNARAAVAQYEKTIESTTASAQQFTSAHENMKRRIIEASVETTGLNQSTRNARSWFRSSRAAASQFGLQLQDVAVQAQAGTDSLIILGQQGSQFLGFFGAAGALAGAAVAIGSALAGVALKAMTAGKSIKELKQEAEELTDAFSIGEDGVLAYNDRLSRLAKTAPGVAKALADIKTRQLELEQSLVISALNDELEEFNKVVAETNATGRNLLSFQKSQARVTRELAEEFGATEEQIKNVANSLEQFKKVKSADAAKELQEALSQLNVESEENLAIFSRLTSFIGKYLETSTLLENGISEVGDSTKTAKEEAEKYIAKLKEESETLGMSREQLVAYEIAQLAATDSTIKNKDALISEAQAYVQNIQAREKLASRMEALEGRRGDPLEEAKKEAAARKKFREELQGKSGKIEEQAMTFSTAFESNPEMKKKVEQWRQEQQNILSMQGQEVVSSPFGSIEKLEMELTKRKQTLQDYFGTESQKYKEHIARLEQNAANAKPFLEFAQGAEVAGKAVSGAMEVMAAAGRESTKEYKAMALVQATISQALAVASVFANPTATFYEKVGQAALAAATVGAQIAAIKSQGFAKGGLVRGPGTGTSDSIPAQLSNGEFVLRADAVRKIGIPQLNAMNQGRVDRMSSGGPVGTTTTSNGSTIINVLDQRTGGAPVETRERTDENGNKNIDILVRDAVNNGIVKGDFDRTLGASFGVRRQGRRV